MIVFFVFFALLFTLLPKAQSKSPTLDDIFGMIKPQWTFDSLSFETEQSRSSMVIFLNSAAVEFVSLSLSGTFAALDSFALAKSLIL